MIRSKPVVLDGDLAAIYGVTTGNFNKAVTRYLARLPDDFAFLLTKEEFRALMSGRAARGRPLRRRKARRYEFCSKLLTPVSTDFELAIFTFLAVHYSVPLGRLYRSKRLTPPCDAASIPFNQSRTTVEETSAHRPEPLRPRDPVGVAAGRIVSKAWGGGVGVGRAGTDADERAGMSRWAGVPARLRRWPRALFSVALLAA